MNKKTAPTNSQKGFSGIIILIAIVALVGVGGLVYYFATNKTIRLDTADGGGVIRVKKSLTQETITDGDMTIITGENIKLPSDFPEVYVYPGAKIVNAVTIGDSVDVLLNVSDTAEEVIAWYREELTKDGWELMFATEDSLSMINEEGAIAAATIIPANIADLDGNIGVGFGYTTKEVMDEAFGSGPSYDDAVQSLKDLEDKVGSDEIEWGNE